MASQTISNTLDAWDKAFADKRLTKTDILLLVFIDKHQGVNNCIWYSHNKLAECLNVHVRTIFDSINHLKELGYIQIIGKKSNNLNIMALSDELMRNDAVVSLGNGVETTTTKSTHDKPGTGLQTITGTGLQTITGTGLQTIQRDKVKSSSEEFNKSFHMNEKIVGQSSTDTTTKTPSVGEDTKGKPIPWSIPKDPALEGIFPAPLAPERLKEICTELNQLGFDCRIDNGILYHQLMSIQNPERKLELQRLEAKRSQV